MHGVHHAQRLGGIERPRVQLHGLVPDRRRAGERDIIRQGLLPLLQHRLKVVTVPAAVPEKFHNLDLAGIRCTDCRGNQVVVSSLDPIVTFLRLG